MKIGILTLPLHVNYGGILQAYALQTVLTRLGHEPEVINREFVPKRLRLSSRKKPFAYAKRILKKLLIDHRQVIDVETKNYNEMSAKFNSCKVFMDAHISCRNVNALSEIGEKEYDVIVVGSDQIWRPRYCPTAWGEDKTNVFLAFAKGWNVRRIAYGASFGVDEWEFPEEHGEEYAALAQLFDAVSVREDSGVALCRDHLGVTAEHVLDPTMLLSADDYKALIDAAGVPQHDGDMFCYVLDRNKDKMALINGIARERSLTPYFIIGNTMLPEDMDGKVHPLVETWLRAFADARFVVTDSFHGCVFSIIFGKPFVAIGNVGRGLSRMESLMRLFGLEDHLLTDTSQYNPASTYGQPAAVRQRLEQMQAKSLTFLKQIND